ncbi:unnamed protein product [Arabidopsis thaliana]|uniref:Uncharacterized protein n=1 Tax=Arabidopsis thaliana TaxID=3702 RepID=A0A654F8T3_ARATH|nr:unnamed protein product [Arabidopsis thaliana]
MLFDGEKIPALKKSRLVPSSTVDSFGSIPQTAIDTSDDQACGSNIWITIDPIATVESPANLTLRLSALQTSKSTVNFSVMLLPTSTLSNPTSCVSGTPPPTRDFEHFGGFQNTSTTWLPDRSPWFLTPITIRILRSWQFTVEISTEVVLFRFMIGLVLMCMIDGAERTKVEKEE